MVDKHELMKLVDGVLTGKVTRRELAQRAAALGFVVPGVLAMRATPDAAAQDAQATPKPGGTLTAIVVDDPKSLDILVTQLAQSRNMMASVYETLTYIDAADPSFPIKGRSRPNGPSPSRPNSISNFSLASSSTMAKISPRTMSS